MLSSLFSEVLSGPEWAALMDHMFTFAHHSGSPHFLLVFAVAYLRYFRRTLMQASRLSDFLVCSRLRSHPRGREFASF